GCETPPGPTASHAAANAPTMPPPAAHGAAVLARRGAAAGRPVPASSPEPTRFIEGSFRAPHPPGPAGRGGPRRRPGIPGSPPAGTFVPASAAAPPFGPLTRPAPDLPAKFVRPVRPRPSHPHAGRRPLIA